MYNIDDFPINPFSPCHPVSPDDFVGRKDKVNKILSQIPSVIDKGHPEHFFITGKCGMGKTSFASYVARIAYEKYNLAPIYVNCCGTSTIDDLIAQLINTQKFINIDQFRKHPENDFIDFLVELCNNLDEYDGLFIIIDDLNSLSQSLKFTNLYKALFETSKNLPIVFNLITRHARFNQMFNVINIDKLDDSDVEYFF